MSQPAHGAITLRFALPLALIALAGLPATAPAATTAFTGSTSPQDISNDGVDNPEPRTFGFNYSGTEVTNVSAMVSLRCPDGSYMNMGTHPGGPGEPIAVSEGRFDATIGDPNSGHGLTWHLVGTISGGQATGTAEVQAHEYSGVAPTGPICTATFTWTAAAPAPAPVVQPPPASSPLTAQPPLPPRGQPSSQPSGPDAPRGELRPVARRRPRPDVSGSIVALRTQDGRRFFWGTEGIRCLNGATHLVVTVRRSYRKLRCQSGLVVASDQVIPHIRYTIRVQPVKVRRRKVVSRGSIYELRLRMPGNDAAWTPVPGLRLP